ncbi:hypothetical protein EI94DRAFT_1794797 [Lactarius quietus]|nr:hypothetical protein EI94DRAFT_1794797 [Lactarius quietus]
MHSKHSISNHLRNDQDFLKTIPPDTESAIFMKSRIDQTTRLLSQLHGGTVIPDTVSDDDRSYPEGSGAALNYGNHPDISTQLDHIDHNQGEAVEPDDFFNPADVDAGVDPDIVLGSTADANLTWIGMDSNISDSEEPDQLSVSSESDSEDSTNFLDQDFDSDEDSDKAELHPAIKTLSDPDNSSFQQESESANLVEEVLADSAADLPEVVKRLRTQLL